MSPQMGTFSHYDEKTSLFSQSFKNAELQATIDTYIHTTSSPQLKHASNQTSVSWQEVFKELEDAKTLYQEKGDRNSLRRSMRNGGLINQTAIPLLEGIPQDDGLGLIKGGLLIIFNAVKRRSDSCRRILDSFERIPDSIIQAQKLQALHPTDETLFSCIRNLNQEIAKCIPLLINILLRKENGSSLKKFGKAVFGDELSQVLEILKPLDVADRKLEECRRNLDTMGIVEIKHASRATMDGVHTIHQNMGNIDQKLDQLGTQFDDSISALRSQIDGWKASNEEKRQMLIIKPEHLHDLANALYMQLQEELRVNSLNHAPNRSPSPGRPPPNEPYLTRVRLMQALCNEKERNAPIEDRAAVLRAYHSFRSNALPQANYLITIPKFKAWLNNRVSDILVVDGQCQEQSVGKISPISVFCASLFEVLSGSVSNPTDAAVFRKPTVLLSFFCRQHPAPHDGLPGPAGLMRSLIDQLLLEWPENDRLDTLFIQQQPWIWEGIEKSDVSTLCYVFGELLRQLGPASLVYCIIDGISQFDTSLRGWNQELQTIVDCFTHYITGDSRTRPGTAPVKILLASADKSVTLKRELPSGHHIDLRAGNLYPRSVSPSNFGSGLRNQTVTQLPHGYSDAGQTFLQPHQHTGFSRERPRSREGPEWSSQRVNDSHDSFKGGPGSSFANS